MKKTTIYIVMAVLCLNSRMQAQDNKVVDVALKGIQIGQRVPDVVLTGLYNYTDSNGKPATTAKLSDFKGKLLILDFWATWCNPCLAMMPKMDSLQRAFGDKVAFLSVTYQPEGEILPFLKKIQQQGGAGADIPVVMGDVALHGLFPHVYLPHYIWIDKDGRYKGWTEASAINGKNIDEASRGEFHSFLVSAAVPVLDANAVSKVIYSSILKGFDDSEPSVRQVLPLDSGYGKRIRLVNNALKSFYRMAYRDKGLFNANNTVLMVKDTANFTNRSIGVAYHAWSKIPGHTYSYTLQTPASVNIFEVMRSDLDRYFPQFKSEIAMRNLDCLVLKQITDKGNLKSKGQKMAAEFSASGASIINMRTQVLIDQLSRLYLQKQQLVILDESGIKDRVDLELEADMGNIASLNNALEKYGLHLVKEVRMTKVLIIADRD